MIYDILEFLLRVFLVISLIIITFITIITLLCFLPFILIGIGVYTLYEFISDKW